MLILEYIIVNTDVKGNSLHVASYNTMVDLSYALNLSIGTVKELCKLVKKLTTIIHEKSMKYWKKI